MTFSFSNFPSSAVNLLIHSVIQLCNTTAQAFLWSIHATARFVWQFLIIPLSESSWSLVPFFRFRYSFCSSASRLLSSKNLYNNYEITPVISFHISGRQKIDLNFQPRCLFLNLLSTDLLCYELHKSSQSKADLGLLKDPRWSALW